MKRNNRMILSLFIFGSIIPLFFGLNVNLNLNNRETISSQSLRSFLDDSQTCVEIRKASFFEGNDSWSLIMEVQINNEIITSNDFKIKKQKIVWNDHIGSFVLDMDSTQELPPLKVKLLLDANQQTLYSTDVFSLNSYETIWREKEFWHDLANSIVRALTFDSVLGDMVVVYYVSQEHQDLASYCSDDSCTYFASGVFNTILDTAELAYKGKTSLSERQTITELFARDERPRRDGEKVIIIVRWRSDPLSENSYPFDDPIFKGRLLVITIDRSFGLSSEFDQIAQNIRDKYDIGIIYVPGPPAEILFKSSTDTNSVSEQIRKYISYQRSLLGFNIRFPYLLDELTAKNGQLEIRGKCEFRYSLENLSYHVFSSKTPFLYYTSLNLAFCLIVFQAILILIVCFYKLSQEFRIQLNETYKEYSE